MDTRQLVELGAVVTAYGPSLIYGMQRFSHMGIHQYWWASKCRQDRWSRALHRMRLEWRHSMKRSQAWRAARPVLEEILASEPLTRSLAAVTRGYESRRDENDLDPMTASVFQGQMEFRERAIDLLVQGESEGVADAVALCRLWRRLDRWSDVLLGYLADDCDVGPFACCPARVCELAADLRPYRQSATLDRSWEITWVAIRSAFQHGLMFGSPNADLNEQLAAGVLACLDPSLFQDTGTLEPTWMFRMDTLATDTQVMIDELLANDDSPEPDFRLTDSRFGEELSG